MLAPGESYEYRHWGLTGASPSVTLYDMTLKWNRKHGNLFAVGRRAQYAITQRGVGTKILTAIDYDGLPLLDLPPFGAVYLNEWHAKNCADELETRYAIEPQMSGC